MPKKYYPKRRHEKTHFSDTIKNFYPNIIAMDKNNILKFIANSFY